MVTLTISKLQDKPYTSQIFFKRSVDNIYFSADLRRWKKWTSLKIVIITLL